MNKPGLRIAVTGRPLGTAKYRLDNLTRNRVRLEFTHGTPTLDNIEKKLSRARSIIHFLMTSLSI
jgi:hypothetical protein